VAQYQLKIKPTEEQLQGARFLLTRPAALLTYQPGTGKSLIMIITAFKLLMEKQCRNVFLVCTKGSLPEVLTDFEKFTNHAPHVAQDVESLHAVKDMEGKIILTQYERLKGVEAQNVPWIFRNCAALFDEVHKLKTRTSQLTQTWNAVRPYLARAYGCTGTAVTSNLDDLFWIVSYLDPSVLGTYWIFRSKYYIIQMRQVSRARKVQEVVGYKNVDDLYTTLKPFMLSFYPERDVRFIEAYGEVSNEAEYRLAAAGLWESLEEKTWSARVFDLQKVVDADKNKLDVLAYEVTQRVASGVIIYCGYYDAVARVESVLDRLKIPHKMIAGKLSIKERLEAKDWFNSAPSGKALLITNAGSQSVNIQATNELIMYNIPSGLGFFVQCCGRIVRMNSKYKFFNIVLVGLKDTVDAYKIKYIQLLQPMIQKLFNNRIIPPLKETMNIYLKKELKTNMLWRRRK
jgi:hypothetical protein